MCGVQPGCGVVLDKPSCKCSGCCWGAAAGCWPSSGPVCRVCSWVACVSGLGVDVSVVSGEDRGE